MRAVNLLLVAILLILWACSTPKKAPAKEKPPTISHTDELKGGTSFSSSIVLKVETERAGLDEEYTWLSNSYPGYSVVRRSHVTRAAKHYDIVRIKTKRGQVRDIYFDSTSFRGKK